MTERQNCGQGCSHIRLTDKLHPCLCFCLIFDPSGDFISVFPPFNSYRHHTGHIYTLDAQRSYAASAGPSGLRTHIGLIRSSRLQMEGQWSPDFGPGRQEADNACIYE
jgi:hypothetical protein